MLSKLGFKKNLINKANKYLSKKELKTLENIGKRNAASKSALEDEKYVKLMEK
tara:strand:- start:133 stop:291 length:159 start_codon:yes stop_codon:yes gene_type:complete